ncbi:MAG: hypothetical protein ACFFBP_11640 [Promethearchaeota archaeon]
MSGLNSLQSSEEIIFYIDLVSNFLKKKQVLKGIRDFIEDKNKNSQYGSNLYGIVIFQAHENPINIYGKENSSSIIEIIEKSWDSREQQKSYLENGLFEIFSYIFWKSRAAKKSYRIVIISDKPSELPEDYYNAVYGLILKAKKFSTFIDIIRIGKDTDYPDTVKLKIIASETQGGVFYCQDDKHFFSVLGSLIQNKEDFKVIKEEDEVLETDKLFFDHLAVDLISLDSDDEELCSICNQEKCPICQAYSDEINKCFNCNTKFHGCCATKYASSNNIGFSHIFRCPQCSTLLKIDEEFVEMVISEDRGEEGYYTIEEVEEESVVLENIREELVEDTSIPDISQEELTEEEIPRDSIVEEEIVSEKMTEEISAIDQPVKTKKVRVGGFFGAEVEVKTNATVQKEGIAPMKVIDTKDLDVKKSITSLNPPKKRKSIKLCKICGSTVSGMTCPNCGAKVT